MGYNFFVLYGNDSLSLYRRGNVFIWMAMAFQAGILNIGGFLACHRFVSHVTGFATHFAVEVSKPDGVQPMGMLIVPVFFFFGSMIAGLLVDLRLKLHQAPKYYLSFGIMFLLTLTVYLGGVTHYFGNFGEPLNDFRDHLLLALLCLVCGIQNGTVTTVSRSIVRTTHLTGITTDLGIGIVRILYRKKLKGEIPDEGKANGMRLGIILSFILGSVAGGFLFTRWEYLGFFVPTITTGLLFGAMVYFQVIRKKTI